MKQTINYKLNHPSKPGCLLVIFVVILSCNPAKKATTFMRGHPEVNAPVCADQFPIIPIFIKGDSVVTTDTMESFEVLVDTVKVLDTVYITKTLPAKTVTRTIYRTDTLVKENTARVEALQNESDECTELLIKSKDVIIKQNTEIKAMKKLRNKWRLWFWIMVGGAGMYTFLKIKKVVSF